MIDINQLKRYNTNLNKMINDMPNLITELAYKEGEAIVGQVKNNTPVDTGLLRNSWHTVVSSPTLAITTIWINNNVKYAPYMEYGHRIVTKKGDTVGWYNGKFMLKRGIVFYTNNLMKPRIERFWSNKFRQYLG